MIDLQNLLNMPGEYYLALVVLLVLIVEAAFKMKQEIWAFPSVIFYATIWLWYFVEVNVNLDRYIQFDSAILTVSYLQVIAFIIAYRAMLPWAVRTTEEKETQAPIPAFTDAARLLKVVLLAWVVLFAIGAITNGQGVLAALFPLDGRRTWKFMWSRSAIGGATSFLLSVGFYTYLIVCAFISVLVHLPKPPKLHALNWAMIVLTWPYFLLGGTRSNFLGVFVPFVLGYIVFGRGSIARKLITVVLLGFVVNALFALVITYRNYGFGALLTGEDPYIMYVGPEREFKGHEGLNMFEELAWINTLRESGEYPIRFGSQYFAEAVNFIPRAIWPGKPLVGIDYAIARGFGSSQYQLGVVATLSFGIIGQGVANAGPLLGPFVAALLMALYMGFLCRLGYQQHSYLRMCLFIAGVAMLPNLGRGFSLLVLWPMVFGYVIVRGIEWWLTRNSPQEENLLQENGTDVYATT